MPKECSDPDPLDPAKPAPSGLPFQTPVQQIAKLTRALGDVGVYISGLEEVSKTKSTLRASCKDGLTSQGILP